MASNSPAPILTLTVNSDWRSKVFVKVTISKLKVGLNNIKYHHWLLVLS